MHLSLTKANCKGQNQKVNFIAVKTTALANYKELRIEYKLKTSLLTLERLIASRILAARSHHGDFADYHT
jgi:hypothetical protein